MTKYSEEKLECLKGANQRLLIKEESINPRDKNLIFVYCPPKVGSTSLVSSLRLFGNEHFTILHIHNEAILKSIYQIEVTIQEIIEYNSYLGKNIYVIDIYRLPIEHKISLFFEKLEKFHFRNSVENMEKYPIEKIIRRFNNLFPHLGNQDYFRREYGILVPETFDEEKKYIRVIQGNVQYIKLRLSDSFGSWSQILKDIFGIDIMIIRDYETSNKSIKNIFKNFMENYHIPQNFLEQIKNAPEFGYYNGEKEREDYLEKWTKKMAPFWEGYTTREYFLYLDVSSDNQTENEIQLEHYIDNGCNCDNCSKERIEMRQRVREGKKDVKIIHKDPIIPRKINVTIVKVKRIKKRRILDMKMKM